MDSVTRAAFIGMSDVTQGAMLAALVDVLGTALDYTLRFFREWWLLLAILVFAMAARPLPRVFTRAATALEAFGSRPWRAAIAAGLLCLVWSAAITAVRGRIPLPLIHDDMACHLAAQ